MSTDHDPANAVLEIDFTSYTSYWQFFDNPDMESGQISLIKGTPYYFEVRHREGGGSDHFAIGVESSCG